MLKFPSPKNPSATQNAAQQVPNAASGRSRVGPLPREAGLPGVAKQNQSVFEKARQMFQRRAGSPPRATFFTPETTPLTSTSAQASKPEAAWTKPHNLHAFNKDTGAPGLNNQGAVPLQQPAHPVLEPKQNLASPREVVGREAGSNAVRPGDEQQNILAQHNAATLTPKRPAPAPAANQGGAGPQSPPQQTTFLRPQQGGVPAASQAAQTGSPQTEASNFIIPRSKLPPAARDAANGAETPKVEARFVPSKVDGQLQPEQRRAWAARVISDFEKPRDMQLTGFGSVPSHFDRTLRKANFIVGDFGRPTLHSDYATSSRDAHAQRVAGLLVAEFGDGVLSPISAACNVDTFLGQFDADMVNKLKSQGEPEITFKMTRTDKGARVIATATFVTRDQSGNSIPVVLTQKFDITLMPPHEISGIFCDTSSGESAQIRVNRARNQGGGQGAPAAAAEAAPRQGPAPVATEARGPQAQVARYEPSRNERANGLRASFAKHLVASFNQPLDTDLGAGRMVPAHFRKTLESAVVYFGHDVSEEEDAKDIVLDGATNADAYGRYAADFATRLTARLGSDALGPLSYACNQRNFEALATEMVNADAIDPEHRPLLHYAPSISFEVRPEEDGFRVVGRAEYSKPDAGDGDRYVTLMQSFHVSSQQPYVISDLKLQPQYGLL